MNEEQTVTTSNQERIESPRYGQTCHCGKYITGETEKDFNRNWGLHRAVAHGISGKTNRAAKRAMKSQGSGKHFTKEEVDRRMTRFKELEAIPQPQRTKDQQTECTLLRKWAWWRKNLSRRAEYDKNRKKRKPFKRITRDYSPMAEAKPVAQVPTPPPAEEPTVGIRPLAIEYCPCCGARFYASQRGDA